jgi:hypothetical protein
VTDTELNDEILLAEIDLLAEVMVQAAAKTRPLTSEEVDLALGIGGPKARSAPGRELAADALRDPPAYCPVAGLMEALIPRKDESHGSTEEVPRGASGAGDQDGGRSAA